MASAESGARPPARGSACSGSCRSSTTRCCPGITERQAAYAAEVGAALADVADVEVGAAGAGPRRTSSARCASFEARGPRRPAGRDAHLRPGDARGARARRRRGCRSAWPTSSPSRRSRPTWDMADLTYNQGIHGAQDTANAMVRAGRPFHVVTDDWQRRLVPRRGRRAGRARPRRSRAGARCKVARLRLRDERHGRHPRRRARAAARARPAGRRARARATLHRGRGRRRRRRRSTRLIAERGRALRDRPASAAPTSARTTRACSSAIERVLRERRLRRVLDALRRDRRGRPLRAAAARRRLEPDGQGLRLRRRGRRPDRRADVGRRHDAARRRRSSPRCTRWTSPATRS